MKTFSFLLFFITSLGFSQNLEETIYLAAETFIKAPNNNTFRVLNKQEEIFKRQVKSKDEQLALVFLQTHKGFYLFQESELSKAISTYEDALNRYNSNELSLISDFDIIENCLNPLGTLYTKAGDFTNALNTINQYIYLAKNNKNSSHQISGFINLSKLYYTLSKHETAISTVEEGLKIKPITQLQKTRLLQIKTECLAALNQLNNTSITDSHRNNYLFHLKNKSFKQAFVAFSSYKKNLLKQGITKRKTAQLDTEEAQLNYLLKQPNEAIKSLHAAIKTLLPTHNSNNLPNKNQLFADNTFIDIFDMYAEIETNPKIALESLDLSFYVSRLMQNSWTSQETKILNETNNRIRSEKSIDILYDTYAKTKNKTLLKRALEYAESSKSSVLKTMFLKKTRLQQFPNDSLLLKEFQLLKTQEQLTSLLVKEDLSALEINNLSSKLSSISIQLKKLNSKISKKHLDTNEPFNFNLLKSKLKKDNAVLIEYFYGKNSIYQFIISEQDINLNRIHFTLDIKQQVSNFINLFNKASTINNDIQNYTTQAFEVYKLLNFDKAPSSKNIIIIPDGLINFIPFEALLTNKTKTTSYSKMPFLIKRQNVVYNSSIVLYLNENVKQNTNTVLGFFPVFENETHALTYSVKEAEAIEKHMPSKLFMKAKASKSNFFTNAPNYGVIHLSTHASSGDFVTSSNLSFFEDTLFLNELYSLDLSPNLVVLSACETGVGKLYKGEGAMSIARGFQYAGAQNILFSLWQINDLSTAQIMESFYKNYSTSQSAYTANQASKISYIENESINNSKKSPYYWSAFVYYGDLTEVKSQNFTIYICIGIFIVLFIVLLAMKLKRK